MFANSEVIGEVIEQAVVVYIPSLPNQSNRRS